MVSKDPIRRKEIGKLGAETRWKKGTPQPPDFGKRVSEGIKNKLANDPIFAKEWSDRSRKGALAVKNRYKFSAEDIKKGQKFNLFKNKKSFNNYHDFEREALLEQKNNNNEIFFNSVIDGIEITNDGILKFIEVKFNSGKLSKNQRKFLELLNTVNKVEYKLIKKEFNINNVV